MENNSAMCRGGTALVLVFGLLDREGDVEVGGDVSALVLVLMPASADCAKMLLG